MENFVRQYKYPLIGAIIGLVLAVLFMEFGFFRTLFLILLTGIGSAAGYYVKQIK